MKENIHGSFWKRTGKETVHFYIMFIPVVLFYVLFMYANDGHFIY